MDVVANTEPDWYEKVLVLSPELELELELKSLLMLLLLMTSLLCSLFGKVAETDEEIDDVDVAFGGIVLYMLTFFVYVVFLFTFTIS